MSGNNQDSENEGPWGRPPSDKPKQNQPQRPRSWPNNKEKDFFNPFKNLGFKGFGNGDGSGPRFTPPRFSIIGGGIALLLVGWFLSGFYRVNEGDVGVVLRFGEIASSNSAGLHYHLPYPMEWVLIQRVSAVNRIDGGITATGDSTDHTLILTGDENMVQTGYTVLWRIKDVNAFLFNTRGPEETIRIAAESVLREVFGLYTARQALTEGRDSIGQKAQEFLQRLMDEYQLGVEIVSFQLQRVEPAAEVIEAFNDVQASLVDADRFRNEAEGYHNDIVPRARGDAQKIIKDAEGYAQEVVARAEGDGLRFIKVQETLVLNRRVLLMRMYLETMHQVLAHTDKIILDAKAAKSMASFIPLTELRKMKTPSPSKEAKE